MRFLLLTTCLLSFLSYAQEATTVIVDKTTNSPIPFMVITTENDVLTTNENGEIEKSKLENIPFKVVSDTYKAQIFDVGFSEDTIFMEQEAKLLEETKIVESKSSGESYQLGYHNKSTKVFPVYGYPMGIENYLIVHIPYDGKKAIVEKLQINLVKVQKDSTYTCLLYSANENQEPDQLIFSYALTGEQLKKKDAIDISNLEIEIPKEGVFVGVKSSEIQVRMVREKFETQKSFWLYKAKEPKPLSNRWMGVQDADFEYFVAAPFGVQMKLK